MAATLTGFIYILFLLIFLLIFSTIALGGLLLAVYAPTPQKAVEAMLKLGKVKKGDKVYDLGSGDGRIIITAAEKFGAESVGFEISFLHFIITKIKIRRKKLSSRVKVYYKNLYNASLKDASVVTIFGIPSKMERIGKILQQKLKPGTRVLSYAFPIPNLKCVKTLKLKNCAPIYLYKL